MKDDFVLPDIEPMPRLDLPFDAVAYAALCEAYLFEVQKDPEFEAKRLRRKLQDRLEV